MDFRFDTDTDVEDAVEQAAAEACQVLDAIFPGYDAGGITSNFQGLLKDILSDMVKGRAPVVRGHSTALPTLVADGTFFGAPNQAGDAFLLTKLNDPVWEKDEAKGRYLPKRHMIALDPVSSTFKPLSECGDAWTSFGAAVENAVKHIRKNGFTMEQAREQGYAIRSVRHATVDGYEVTDEMRMVG
jgi:biotin operon repressor